MKSSPLGRRSPVAFYESPLVLILIPNTIPVFDERLSPINYLLEVVSFNPDFCDFITSLFRFLRCIMGCKGNGDL